MISNTTDNCMLTVSDLKGKHSFCLTEIIRLEAADNYTIFYFAGHRSFVSSRVLKIYEALLLPYGFVRTHRSHLVNRQFIKKIDQTSIIMSDASIAEITKKKKKKILRQLHQPIDC